MEKPKHLKHTGRVRLRALSGLAFVGLVGISQAQFLTGTSGSLSSGFASDSASYTPSTGSPVSVDNYYSNSQSPPDANFTDTHSFSSLVIPGAGGTTSASELGSVVDSLSIGANSANFSSTILARSNFSTSITQALPDKEVTASSQGQAQDSLLFTVGQSTQLTLTGSSTVGYTGQIEAPFTVTLELINETTNQTLYIVQQDSTTINSILTLAAGSYQLYGYADVATGIDYSAFQGTLKNDLGNASIDLQYNAAFAPTPAPEPATMTLLTAGLGAAIRRRSRRI